MTEHATTGDAINHAIDKASDGLTQIAHALSGAAPQAWAMTEKEARLLLAEELENGTEGGRFWVPATQVELFYKVTNAAVAVILRLQESIDASARELGNLQKGRRPCSRTTLQF